MNANSRMDLNFILGTSSNPPPTIPTHLPPNLSKSLCSQLVQLPHSPSPSSLPSPTTTTSTTSTANFTETIKPTNVKETAIYPSPSCIEHSDSSSHPQPLPSPLSAIDHLANAACQAAHHLEMEQRSLTSTPSPPYTSPPSLSQIHHNHHNPESQLNQLTIDPFKGQPSRPETSEILFSPVSSSHSNFSHQEKQITSSRQLSSPINSSPNTEIGNLCRTHVCVHCTKSFTQKVRFLYHLLAEHGVKDYESRNILPCSKCSAAFLRNTDRSKHDLCVHQRLRPYKCSMENCNSAFFFEKDLTKHRSTVHLRHKPFRCSICTKAFGKREHMTSHVKRVHHKLRPFRCDVCDIRLASKYNLQGHLKTAAHATAESLQKKKDKQSANKISEITELVKKGSTIRQSAQSVD